MKVVIILTIIKPEIGPGFFDDLGSEDMSIFKAFNELIANSIDSWIQKGKTKTSRGQLTINIHFEENAIIISDNAAGMNKQDMINAMGFGVAQKSSSEFGEDLMGTYGFGLKASTSALGRHFEVISKMANKKIIHSVMPIGKMKDEQSWQSDIEEKINSKSLLEESEIKSYLKLGKTDSGTMVYISDVRQGLNLDEIMMNKSLLLMELGIAWKNFIQNNNFGKPVKIFVDGELIEEPEKGYKQKGMLPNSLINFTETIEFTSNKDGKKIEHEEVITGSIWVNTEGGQFGDSGGFNTYRKGQLVQRNDNLIFKVTTENARVEGELYLDFIPANQRKTYFDEKHPGYVEVTKFLKQLVPGGIVKSSVLNIPVISDPTLLNKWMVEKWYTHFMNLYPELELPKELKRIKKIDPSPEPPSKPIPPPPGSPIPPKPPEEDFEPLSEDSFKFNGVVYTIIYIKGNCGGNIFAYKVDQNRIQINVDDNIDGINKKFQKDLTKIINEPSGSGYAKIAKQLITQSVIQQFLTRTLGPNEALKQSQKWMKFVNK